MSYIDITVPLRSGMAHYPGDPAIELTSIMDMRSGAVANVKLYSFGSHSGTHFDPPFHQVMTGIKADEIPADYFIGRAKVFGFMSGRDIDEKDIQGLDIQPDDIVLFKTPNSPHMLDPEFYEDFVGVLPDAAEILVEKGVRAVGVDYLSIEKYASPVNKTHHLLLGAGIPIIEGLYLADTEPGTYKMTAMFMLVEDSDGAPIRAILEKE